MHTILQAKQMPLDLFDDDIDNNNNKLFTLYNITSIIAIVRTLL